MNVRRAMNRMIYESPQQPWSQTSRRGIHRKYSRRDWGFLLYSLPFGLGLKSQSRGGDDESSHRRGDCVIQGCRPEVDRAQSGAFQAQVTLDYLAIP